MSDFTYEVVTSLNGNQSIKRSDGWAIPTDPSNADYQAYLSTLPSNSSIPQAGE